MHLPSTTVILLTLATVVAGAKPSSQDTNRAKRQTGTCTSCGAPGIDLTTTDQLAGVPSPNMTFSPYTASDNCQYLNVSCTGYGYAGVYISIDYFGAVVVGPINFSSSNDPYAIVTQWVTVYCLDGVWQALIEGGYYIVKDGKFICDAYPPPPSTTTTTISTPSTSTTAPPPSCTGCPNPTVDMINPVGGLVNSPNLTFVRYTDADGCEYFNATCTGYGSAIICADNFCSVNEDYDIPRPRPLTLSSKTSNFKCFDNAQWLDTDGIMATYTGNVACYVDSLYPATTTSTTTTTTSTTTTTTSTTTTTPTTTTTSTTTPTTTSTTPTSTTTTTPSTTTTTTTPTTTTTTKLPMCCPLAGIWSEWSFSPEQCGDYCGSCGNQTKTRTCLSAADGCPCSGSATETFLCGTNVCDSPRLSCCPPYIATVIDGQNACGPMNVTIDVPPKNTCGVTCCPSEGIWSEWSTVVSCNDTCGSCGTETVTRTCLSTQYGCDCAGLSTLSRPCGSINCLLPRQSCCPGFAKQIINRTVICGPLPLSAPLNATLTTCCDPEGKGLWNVWSSWSSCTATCGMCGNQSRTRTCASAPYGCPCVGETQQTQACGDIACTGGSACCTGTFLATGYDGAQFCQTKPPTVCTGVWTDWTSATACNDTCGMFGSQQLQRYCFPSGCTCSGNSNVYTTTAACGAPSCTLPRPSCAPGYQKSIVNRIVVCVPTVSPL